MKHDKYNQFVKLEIDFNSIGLEQGNHEGGYFCTPLDSYVIGWESCGIHYCFIEGYDDMVFAVNPESVVERNVYPLAQSFEDFLRLLLTCKTTTAIEQIVGWNKQAFDEFIDSKDNEISESGIKSLQIIRDTFYLKPMPDPFSYVKTLQSSFDDSKIRYSSEYYDTMGLDYPEEETIQGSGTQEINASLQLDPSDAITTYSGIHFYPLHPNLDDFRIEDIAHALSLICRGNGHVKQFFSVGQHCIHCTLEAQARHLSNRVCLACLLHDASEAYLSDVPRPFKKKLPDYIELEEMMLSKIYTRFLGSDLTKEEKAQVKSIDNDLLAYDLAFLLNEYQIDNETSHIILPVLYHDFHHEIEPFLQVEQNYLSLFYQLNQML